jgi:hypothetical protein
MASALNVDLDDLVAAAREFIRSQGCVVSIGLLLDWLSRKFGERFVVSPDTYKVLNLISILWKTRTSTRSTIRGSSSSTGSGRAR